MAFIIGADQKVGVGVGADVAPDVYIPRRADGVIQTTIEPINSETSLGNIYTVTDTRPIKSMSNIPLGVVINNDTTGWLFYGLFGVYYRCDVIALSGGTGTPAQNDSVTATAGGTWVGTIRKIIKGESGGTFYLVSTDSGTLADAMTVQETGGAGWTGFTVESSDYADVKAHYFELIDTNINRPALTIHNYTPNSQYKATYVKPVDFSFTASNGATTNLDSNWMGKVKETTTGLSPSFADINEIFAPDTTIYLATNEAGLNDSTTDLCFKSFNFSGGFGTESDQCLGSANISEIITQGIGPFEGSATINFDDEDSTLYDLVVNNTEQAVRIKMLRDDLDPLYTTGELYHSVFVDFPKLKFNSDELTSDLYTRIEETVNFTVLPSASNNVIEIVMLNDQDINYDGS